MNKIEKIKCNRCQQNEVSFFCHMCPKQFNKLCFDCDAFVHSIIPYKIKHKRDNIENTDEYKATKERQIKNEKIEEMKNKIIHQNNLINDLNLKIKEFKNEIYQLIEQIQNFKREKESYMKELDYLKIELESYKKENKSFKENLCENNLKSSKLNNEINMTNNKLHERESELEEIKYY